MRILSNWRSILVHAWSIRFMALAAIFSGAEIAWPFFDGLVPIPHWIFGLISGFLTMAAITARLVVQKKVSGE